MARPLDHFLLCPDRQPCAAYASIGFRRPPRVPSGSSRYQRVGSVPTIGRDIDMSALVLDWLDAPVLLTSIGGVPTSPFRGSVLFWPATPTRTVGVSVGGYQHRTRARCSSSSACCRLRRKNSEPVRPISVSRGSSLAARCSQ